MKTSDATDLLDAALSAALGEMTNPAKSKTATVVMKENKGKYSYNYADIADVLTMCRPILSKHKIALIQTTVIDSGLIVLQTRLSHGGQWVESDYPVCRAGNDHKEMGAAMTYSRRYALSAMLGVAAEDDTDGDGAANSGKPEPHQKQAPKAPDGSPAAVSAAKMAIGLCETPEALDGWLTANGDAIRQYCDSDRAQIRSAVQARKAAFAKEPAREIFE